MKTFPRLGIDLPPEPAPHAEQLRRLVIELQHAHPCDPAVWEAIGWLDRLSRKPRVLALLASKGRGRNRETRNLWLALDYLASREIEGWRKWKRAQSNVAEAWRVPPKRVSDAWTDYRRPAEALLTELLHWSVARGLTRRAALEAVSADIREANTKPRRKTR
mgnify:CR=1 FL=1